MRTCLIFNTARLIENLNSSRALYNIKENKNNLLINKVYKNKKRGRPFSATFPQQIKISPEVVGLIVGEGFLSDRHFVFANSNEEAIDEVMDFLKQFNLPIKSYLEISVKEKSKEFINECITYWQTYLKVKIKKIRLRKEFYNITKYGTLHLIVNNSLLAKLLSQILKQSKIQMENNKNLAIGYLKGILAAEGNINVKKSTNCVYMVRISASKKEEREHYKRCLKKVGVKIYCKDMPTVSSKEGIKRGWKTTSGRAGAVIISKWDNFIKLLELNLLELSEDKKQKFHTYLLNNKFTRQFLDFKPFINKKFTMKQAQDYFNFSGRHLNRILTLFKKGYIDRKLIKNHYVYKINNKYFKVYEILTSHQHNPTSQ